MTNKTLLKTGIIGTIIAAICCFTPVLVLVLGALGLGAYVASLDVILLPLLGICLIIVVVALIRRNTPTTEEERNHG